MLEQVADFKNLLLAFHQCSRGKKASHGHQSLHFGIGETLLEISNDLREGHYKWGDYRTFTISDPKPRFIMSAPFKDRIVHHAICQVIGPPLDHKLSDSVFACRRKKGSRQAALYLWKALEILGPKRFVCKVDISKYYESIDHETLLEVLNLTLKSPSIFKLLKSLLESYGPYQRKGRGIPIGNLTSQHFANFYLAAVDKIACAHLGAPYVWDIGYTNQKSFYIRYMDDSVFAGPCKKTVMKSVWAYQNFVQEKLKLNAGYHKIAPLGDDPVPFLGYVFTHEGYRPLARNLKRFQKSEGRLMQKTSPPSRINQSRVSQAAWELLDKKEFNGGWADTESS